MWKLNLLCMYIAVEVWNSKFPDVFRLNLQISRMNLEIWKFSQKMWTFGNLEIRSKKCGNLKIWKFSQNNLEI